MFSLSKFITLGIMLIFGSIGFNFFPDLFIYLFPNTVWIQTPMFSMMIGVALGFVVSLFVSQSIEQTIKKIREYFATLNVSYVLFGTLGAIIGLIVAWLLNISFLVPISLPVLSDIVPGIVSVVGAYIGFEVGSSRREEIRRLFMPRSEEELNTEVLERKEGENYRK